MRNNDLNIERIPRYSLILLFLFTYVFNINASSDSIKSDIQDTNIQDITIEIDTLTIPPLTYVESFKIDTAFSRRFHKKHFKLNPAKINIYELPYSFSGNFPNYKRMGLNTGVLYGVGFLTLGVLYLLPENATAWNKEEMMKKTPWERWISNVKKGPVVDKDNFVFNYILHPYGGAAYYMGARSIGFSAPYSFLYCTAISTFFWEYGIEAFMEIPSIQDLLITPFVGSAMGECFYLLKRHIVSNEYRLFGSPFLGNVTAYLIDPINEVIGIFAGNPNRRKKYKSTSTNVVFTPYLRANRRGFSLNISF